MFLVTSCSNNQIDNDPECIHYTNEYWEEIEKEYQEDTTQTK